MTDLIEPLSTSDLLARAIQTLDALLPDGWDTSLASATTDPYADRRIAPEALLEVEAPDGSSVAFAIAAKLTFTGRDVGQALTTLLDWCEQNEAQPLVVARYLSSTVREKLLEEQASFVDATGNVSVSSAVPAIALSRPGLGRDPWRRASTRDSLRGEPASRVVRALCDYALPMPISQLIELSGASAGATYRVLDLLIDEGLAEKTERGWIESVDEPALLRRWAGDWAEAESRFTLHFETEDGPETTLNRLAKMPKDTYALGGGHAAALVVGFQTPQTALIHCEDAAALIAHLRARPASRASAGDLIVHGRGLSAAAAESGIVERLTHAAPSQAYADLVLMNELDAAAQLLRALAATSSAED